jgi:hypothetical protein
MHHAYDAPENPFSPDQYDVNDPPKGMMDWVESLDNENVGTYFNMYVMYGSRRFDFMEFPNYSGRQPRYRFSTVKCVVDVGEEKDQTLTAQDIRSSPVEQWWLLPGVSLAADDRMGNYIWVLINFVEKRMYTEGNRHEAVVWDDPWDFRSWKTFTTLEEIRNHRKN